MGNSWPNSSSWSALRSGVVSAGDRRLGLEAVSCGELVLPTGRLVVCDPFAAMRKLGNAEVRVPAGRFPVVVTLADVSAEQDGSHIREAYASLVLRDEPEARREFLVPLAPGQSLPSLEPEEFQGFVVDAGTACFVDAASLEFGMPEEADWYEQLFDSGEPESWFSRMDDPGHIRPDVANISLPLAKHGENLVLFHSGWGDGVYPVIGGYNAEGVLVAVHIDFMVIPEPGG